MDTQALPYIIILALLWGSNLVVARFGLSQFNPIVFVGLRLLLASLAHLTVYITNRSRRLPTDRALWWRAIVLGTLGTAVPMTLIIAALEYLSAGLTAVLVTTSPAVTVLLAHFFLPDESLSRRKSLGIALALGGALLLALSGESGLPNVGRANPVGVGLVLVGVVFVSVSVIYTRKYVRDFDTFDVASARMFVATVTVMPVAVLFAGIDLSGVDYRGYATLLYSALLGAFAGLLLELWIIQRFGATAAALTSYVIPIVATVGGILFLDETLSPVMIAGMVLIIVGIGLVNRRRAPVTTESAVRLP